MGSVACKIKNCKYNEGIFCKKIVVIIGENGQCAELEPRNQILPYNDGWTAAGAFKADNEQCYDAAKGNPSRNSNMVKNNDGFKEEQNDVKSEKVEIDSQQSREIEKENNNND